MSKYSGRCDLYDTIEIYGGFSEFMSYHPRIVIINDDPDADEHLIPLVFAEKLDLAPYYGYTIAAMAADKERKEMYIRLAK